MQVVPRVSVSPPGPKSLASLKRLQGVIGRGNYMGLFGITLARAFQGFVEDLDGNIYLDCLCGAAANNLGYDYPEVAEAYHRAALKMPHTSFSYSPSLQPIELAERLTRLTPGTFPKKVFLGLCGSKSNEDALEIAWQVTRRTKILIFDGCYLGATWLTKVASGFIQSQYISHDPASFQSLPFPCKPQNTEPLLQQIEALLSAGEIAAAVIEPILCDGGHLMPPNGFYRRLAALLKQYGSLLIVDECQTGMARTGRWWCSEWEQLEPDLLVTGKGLSSGYAPISATIGKQELMDVIEPGKQIGTYIGHPPSAAAALAVIECIERDNLVALADERGALLRSGLDSLCLEFPHLCVGVRGRGLLLGLEINHNSVSKGAKIFTMRCLEKGLYLGYYGMNQEVVRIAPPLNLTLGHVDFILSIMRETLQEMTDSTLPAATVAKVERFAIGLPMPKVAGESYCLV